MTATAHEATLTSASPRAAGGRAALLVWLVWAAMLTGILVSIARDGRNIPFEEDWLLVAPMTGHEPDIPRWLWSQNSEHRLPLPRLVNLALLRATGDFRATMVFDALALAAVAAAMILTARRLRQGRTSLADAFFPLLLLHLGNWDNLVWAWQIQFVLPTVLACVLLLVIVARPAVATRGAAIAAAIALVGLPLSGANGLLFAPTLAGWLAYTAWAQRRAPGAPGGAVPWLPVGAAGLAVLLCGAYFVGYEASPWNQPSPGWGATLETAGKFLAMSVGPVAAKSWLLFGVVVAAVGGTSLVALASARREWTTDRVRIVGLLAFFAAAALLVLAVGWGRAGRAVATGRMPTRYVLLAAPGLCAAYFTLALYGRPWLRRAGPAALAALLALLLPFNTRAGLQRREWFGAGFSAFERDLASGMSPTHLARDHHAFMLHWDEPMMVASMRMLHDARIGPFVRLAGESTPAGATRGEGAHGEPARGEPAHGEPTRADAFQGGATQSDAAAAGPAPTGGIR
ncbi:MAG TPA: hypothetical protein VFS11_05510 [Gemmatimonadales bacterium]|nr:hypothetical protein [Gemmatimonadales bacterium]